MSKRREVLVRIVAVALFVAGFQVIWQPSRSAIAMRVATSLLADIGDGSGFEIEGKRSPAAVVATGGSESAPYSFSIPGGLHFLIPGLILIAYAPRRLYWLGLFCILIGIGFLSFCAFALGVSGILAGFLVHDFVQQYVIPPVSMAFPIWMIFRTTSTQTSNEGVDHSNPGAAHSIRG